MHVKNHSHSDSVVFTTSFGADGGLSAGAIAGIAVGSVVGVIVLLVVVMGALFCLLPMCKSKKTKYDAI